jgi:hypothetical protein
MNRQHRTSELAAALLTLLALPGVVAAQSSSTAKPSATITIQIDPWITGTRRETQQTRVARSNLRTLNDALEPYRMTYANLTDGERIEIRRAFGDLLPSQRFASYRINAPQARAITFLALGPVRGRREHRCEFTKQPEPAPVLAGEPTRPSWCDAALDTMSRNAAWIHTTILALGRSGGGHRPKNEDLADLRSMAERAREIMVSTPRCGCTIGDDADALLTSTREAVDAVTGSSVPAWMTLRGEHVQRISKLADSVERSLLRCLSAR